MIARDLFGVFSTNEDAKGWLETWVQCGGFCILKNTVDYYNIQVAQKKRYLELQVANVETKEDANVISFSSDVTGGSHVVYLQKQHENALTVCDPWCGKIMQVNADDVDSWQHKSFYKITAVDGTSGSSDSAAAVGSPPRRSPRNKITAVGGTSSNSAAAVGSPPRRSPRRLSPYTRPTPP
jgi:hypothetical protein